MTVETYTATDMARISSMVRETLENAAAQMEGMAGALWTETNVIPHKAVSGFIPFTDGGWETVMTFDLHSELSYQVSRITSIVESDLRDCKSDFRREHDIGDDIDVYDHPDWEEWETDWIYGGDGAVWFLKVRAVFYLPTNRRNVSGEPEYLFCAGVNDDLNYGRDSVGAWAGDVGTHWFYDENVPVGEINNETLDRITRDMVAAFIERA